MFTIIIETKNATVKLEECSSYNYDKDCDTLRITRMYGKEWFCIPYREILHYIIKAGR